MKRTSLALAFAALSLGSNPAKAAPECPVSKITMYTSKSKYADTETGLYFCNGADKGCSRLETPNHDDFEKGATKDYDLITAGGSDEWFCICGSRDAWTGEVKKIQLCGRDLTTSDSETAMRLSMSENVGSAYQCAKVETGPTPVLSPWKPATWNHCGMHVFVVSLKYLGTAYSFPEKTVTFGSNGDSALLNRWNQRDFIKGGNSARFFVVLEKNLGETFKICALPSSGDLSFLGALTTIEAPISDTERVNLTPWSTSSFRINAPNFEKGDPPAKYYSRCVEFKVNLATQSFSPISHVFVKKRPTFSQRPVGEAAE